MIWTVIFFFVSVGPAIFTSLRLNRSPVTRRKKTRKRTIANCPRNARAFLPPAHRYSVARKAGSTTCTLVTPRCVGAGSDAAAATLSISLAARCIFSIALASSVRRATLVRSASRRVALGTSSTIAMNLRRQLVGAEAERAAQQHDHQRRANPSRHARGGPGVSTSGPST